MRTLYDSVDAGAIPADAQLVAGYVDGRYAWSDTDWARWSHVPRVRIAVLPSTDAGDVLDVERGDARPIDAPGWCLRRRAAGAVPAVYCSASAWPDVRLRFADHRLADPLWWIADWTGIAHLPAGAVACQWQSTARWDRSQVADHWPGVDAAAAPPAAPAPPDPAVARALAALRTAQDAVCEAIHLLS